MDPLPHQQGGGGIAALTQAMTGENFPEIRPAGFQAVLRTDILLFLLCMTFLVPLF
jgi:hypothetical protein